MCFLFCVSFYCFLPQELELLSVRESVELLSAVAQLDTSEVSPCMIEIAQLCGRRECILVSIYIY